MYHFARFDGVAAPEAVADGGPEAVVEGRPEAVADGRPEVGRGDPGEDRVDVDAGNKFAASLACLRSRCVEPVPPANVCCIAEPAPP